MFDFFYPISLLPVADYGVGWSLILVTTALLLAASAGRKKYKIEISSVLKR